MFSIAKEQVRLLFEPILGRSKGKRIFVAAHAFLLKTLLIRGAVSHAAYKLRFLRSPQVQSRFVGRHIDLCIEGFPRSANSYAYNMFHVLNPDCVVARHLHTVSQVTMSYRLHVPVLLLIREPHGTLRSFGVKYGKNQIDILLRSYILYYKSISKYSPYAVISDFATTTSKFHLAIDQVNARFGTEFNCAADANDEDRVMRTLKEFSDAGRGEPALPPVRSSKNEPAGSFSERDCDPGLLKQAISVFEHVKQFAI